jgi:hypothetical protein
MCIFISGLQQGLHVHIYIRSAYAYLYQACSKVCMCIFISGLHVHIYIRSSARYHVHIYIRSSARSACAYLYQVCMCIFISGMHVHIYIRTACAYLYQVFNKVSCALLIYRPTHVLMRRPSSNTFPLFFCVIYTNYVMRDYSQLVGIYSAA